MNLNSFTFLGTSGSFGIPVIGCDCQVCKSPEPKNKRTRPSGMLTTSDGKNILIDISPEFRLQAIQNNIDDLDALIITHAHADHILGFDDLRIICERHEKTIPVYANQDTLSKLESMFGYALRRTGWKSGIPHIETRQITTDAFDLFGLKVIPVPLIHHNEIVFGYRFGDFAYLTDFSSIEESSLELLKGLETVVISVVREKPHPKHMHLSLVIEMLEKLQPTRVLLTHMAHELDHNELLSSLPKFISPAYDGLRLEL
jgi:phosphoribosyl 1,2-cyclic phosphate phosphodiesterase